MKILYLLMIAMILSLCSCDQELAHNDVNEHDLVGLWKIDPKTSHGWSADVNEDQKALITLSKNGVCRLTDCPIISGANLNPLNNLFYIDDYGSWKLERNITAWRVVLTIRLEGYSFDVRHDEHGYLLTEDILSPDESNRIAFRKVTDKR